MKYYFSIIIRFYNAEQWLSAAIESVLRQSFKDWELVLVNDCSTDNGANIAAKYAHNYSNIRLFTLESNSGNGKKPGDVGVSKSLGEYCLFLDSDDELEEQYLEKFYVQLEKTKADVALPIMGVYDAKTKKYHHSIPNDPIAPGVVILGYQACSLTLPNYRIGGNGMAFKKSLYRYVDEFNPYCYLNSDEMSERVLLYYANQVVFTDAEYIYWQLESSMSHKLTPKQFEFLLVDALLMKFTMNHYGEALCKAHFKHNLSQLLMFQKKFFLIKRLHSHQEQAKMKSILKSAFKELRRNIAYSTTLVERCALFNYPIFSLYCLINACLKIEKK